MSPTGDLLVTCIFRWGGSASSLLGRPHLLRWHSTLPGAAYPLGEQCHQSAGSGACLVQSLGPTARGVARWCLCHELRSSGSRWQVRWAEAHIKIARMTLTVKLDRNWSSFQLANSAPPLSVTDSAIAPSARMLPSASFRHPL